MDHTRLNYYCNLSDQLGTLLFLLFLCYCCFSCVLLRLPKPQLDKGLADDSRYLNLGVIIYLDILDNVNINILVLKRDSAENGLGLEGGASGAPNSGGAGANPRGPSGGDGLLETK